MSNVITVDNLGKKYLLQHEKGSQSYVTLRDLIYETMYAFRQKLLHPFRSSTGKHDQSREEFWALKNVSFEVRQGERIGIIGRNGAGKSTLLKILSRITEPTTGSAKIKGRVASLLEVGTGFHPELTGRENIFLNGAILGMSRREIKNKFDEIVDFAEISKFLDTPVKRYSSGMYVRLAFAVAAHLEPEILVVDEVLAVGDTQFQRKCLGKMEEVSAKEGRTVLFVSHNMASINNLCSSVIWFDKGRIFGSGKTEEVIREYLLSSQEKNADVKHIASPSARVALNRIWVTTDEGIISSELDVTQSFQINVEFEVREQVAGIDIGVWVRNLRDVPVFFTNLSEINQGKIPEFTPGLYVGSFRVPALFLVPDIYRLMVKAHMPNIWAEDEVFNAGEFNIVETGSLMSRYNQAWRWGVVLGNFPWALSKNRIPRDYKPD